MFGWKLETKYAYYSGLEWIKWRKFRIMKTAVSLALITNFNNKRWRFWQLLVYTQIYCFGNYTNFVHLKIKDKFWSDVNVLRNAVINEIALSRIPVIQIVTKIDEPGDVKSTIIRFTHYTLYCLYTFTPHLICCDKKAFLKHIILRWMQ